MCPTPIVCASNTNPPVNPTPNVCPNSCPITQCPPGESLWNPDSPACECVKDGDVCKRLGDLTAIAVSRYHPNNPPASDFINSFGDGKGNAFTDSASLKAASPCMEEVRARCAQNMIGDTRFGFSSYRFPDVRNANGIFIYPLSPADGVSISSFYDEYAAASRAAGVTPASREAFYALGREQLKYTDTCMASALQYRYGIGELASKGKVQMNGVEGDLLQATGLLYKDCRPVEPWKQKAIDAGKCSVEISASYNEFTSPVSLLWSADVKIREVSSRSKFPLNPKEAGKWFVWRGSGLTPLVVWDPANGGVITSAAQLFGTHTWGKEWKHGYEPLASLDKDRNGWLENDELKDLALWFDFNQDGISDKGEVKQLADVDVTALGVQVTATDEKNGEVHAAKGFRRSVRGSVVEGASVDWFSGPEDGRFGMEALDEGVLQVAQNIEKATNPATASFDSLDEVSGLWDWRVVDRDSEELPENMPHGTIVLYSTNKEIKGTVYVTEQFAPNKSGIGERVSHRPITGVAKLGEKGRPQVAFSTTSPAGGVVESIAQLSEDGMYLAGVTTESQEQGKAPLKYAWVARRAPLKK